MNLLERVVATRNQLETIEHEYSQGKITGEDLKQLLKIYLLKVKAEDNIIKVGMNLKRVKRATNDLIGPVCADNEMIACPDNDGKFISRVMCLEYSGTHTDKCLSCKNFGTTKKLLIDNAGT